MKKHNQILAGILILQLVLIAVTLVPRQAAGGAGEPLLGELTAEEVVAVTIEDAAGARLVMRQVAGAWVLPEAGDFPATEGTVDELLTKLVAIDTSRLVTKTEASHKRLQVARDDFQRQIELETADGERLTLYLGSSPNYGATHVRLEGQDETYLTGEVQTWGTNATPNSWVNTSYLSLPQADLVSVELQNAQGTFVFEKDADDQWTLAGLAEGELPNTSTISSLVSRSAAVTLVRPLGKEDEPAYGLAQPGATIILRTADKTVTLLVGAKDESDSTYVVKSSESPYYVRVSQYSAQDLVEKGRDDLIQLPTPTPEAEATATP